MFDGTGGWYDNYGQGGMVAWAPYRGTAARAQFDQAGNSNAEIQNVFPMSIENEPSLTNQISYHHYRTMHMA